jgi:hypothetical protein
MKIVRTGFLSVMCMYIAAYAYGQSMVVVNNTPGVTADFADLQTAVNTVPAGTLILLQPGPVSYGDVVVKKMISIIGGGYFLGSNPAPYTQATPSSSVIDRIEFDSLSNGSYITGLSISGPVSTGSNSRLSFIAASDITISRCYISRTQHPASSNLCYSERSSFIYVKQCYVESAQSIQVLVGISSTAFFFSNNIFGGQGNKAPVEPGTYNTSGIHFNNNTIFNWQNENQNPSYDIFENNIIIQPTGTTQKIDARGGATNNVTTIDFEYTPAPAPNIVNVDPTTLFITANSTDGVYQLKPGSPASGYGTGGVDAGAFGGLPDDQYVLSGISEFVPNIYFLNVPTVGAHTGGLPVHIKIKANK